MVKRTFIVSLHFGSLFGSLISMAQSQSRFIVVIILSTESTHWGGEAAR